MKKDIIELTQELRDAMLECYEADIAETQIKVAKIKAHKRLTMAQDALREVRFSY